MHPIQEKLLKVIEVKNIGGFTLREIGYLVGEKLPQKVKHHLSQLERKGFVVINKKNQTISRVTRTNNTSSRDIFVSLPIVGSANCGPQTIYADQNIEGYLKVSKKIVPKVSNVFVLRAEGNSLNRANIKGKNIEDGDFVIVDSESTSPKNNDYVVSIIGGLANIKKYIFDKENSQIVLLSESSQHFDPIFIHEDDDFRVNGEVIDVIKKPKFNSN
ncbi:MAG: S24 family peptidase [Candidatus Paceibacterota bacterium]